MRCSAVLGKVVLLSCVFGQSIFPHDPPAPPPIFREAAQETGLDFEHFIGATGEFYLPENMGAGVALLDYDGDGDLDVYLVQCTLLDKAKQLRDSLFPPPSRHWPGNRLFRNDLVPIGQLRFTDVTREAGVGYEGYGMGVAVGDYNNDGHADLFVTNFGSNVLYRNGGAGTFTDVSREAGLTDSRVRWNTSAAFVDYDRDGNLDLFVAKYVNFTIKGNKVCRDSLGIRDYCTPSAYEPLTSHLYRNQADGSFAEVTGSAGIGSASGAGLGVVCADFNADGWMDIFVANDGTPNHLWINKKNGTFEEAALASGTAYSEDGKAEAGMGVTAADYDNDGDEDLFIAHLPQENHRLYVNEGASGKFRDATIQSALALIPHYTGFGTEWFDYDNDGFLDLFVANGAVRIMAALRGAAYPYQQRNQLLHNEGNGKFRETTALAGPALALSGVYRGAAFGDIDNDGDIDMVVSSNNGPARLLLNQTGSRQHWLEVRLEGVKSNRQGAGARVGVLRQGKPTLWRRAHTDGSYLSANDIRVHFGLGRDPDMKAVVVQWPSGTNEIWNKVSADRAITLREGSGAALPSSVESRPEAARGAGHKN